MDLKGDFDPFVQHLFLKDVFKKSVIAFEGLREKLWKRV